MRPAELVFFHGLDSSPMGRKAAWLRDRYQARTPQFDNAAVSAALHRGERSPDVLAPLMDGPLQTAREALAEPTSVLVGSSFGGLLAARMRAERTWRGPTVLLAPAARMLYGPATLDGDARIVVIHGRNDTVIPVEQGRALARTGPKTVFWEVDDDHRLGTLLDSGLLAAAIAWVTA
jgi:pimeloyl-ACP methyl ester carboxylesterase